MSDYDCYLTSLQGSLAMTSPMCPLHPNGEQYAISIDQYTLALPYRDTRTQPSHGVAEPEEKGDSISHWHADGIEIDPKPIPRGFP